MISPRKRLILKIVIVLFCVCLLGYWFFMHTNRGSSIAVYVIGGWHAPLSVKYACGKETDYNVARKFELPLLFDEDTKDQLRGFWFYSYFRGCLHRNGYDFKGNPIPKSSFITTSEKSKYQNTYGNLSFSVSTQGELLTDNSLNVDFDDSRLHSQVTIGTTTFTIDSYTRHDFFKSFDDIRTEYTKHPFSTTTITEMTESKNSYGASLLHITESDGTERIVSFTSKGYVIDIFAQNPDATIMNEIQDTLDK